MNPSDPADDTIPVSAKAASKLPIWIALFLGAAALCAASGYYLAVYRPEQLKIERERQAQEESRLKEQARLERARGGLVVRTRPAGADVQVGSIALEKSPVTLKDLKLGSYPVKITKAGFQAQSLNLKVEENVFADPGEVVLVPVSGKLEVTSEPSALEAVIVAKNLVASGLELATKTVRTPWAGELPEGEYSVQAKRQGWDDKSLAVQVREKKPDAAKFQFPEGKIEIGSNPPGQQVAIDGKSYGVSPCVFVGPPRSYAVEIQRPGWPVVQRTIALKEGDSQRFSAEFPAGSLKVTSDPADAEVWLGERLLGKTPLPAVELAPQRDAELRLKKPGYAAELRKITIAAGETLEQSCELKRERGIKFAGIDEEALRQSRVFIDDKPVDAKAGKVLIPSGGQALVRIELPDGGRKEMKVSIPEEGYADCQAPTQYLLFSQQPPDTTVDVKVSITSRSGGSSATKATLLKTQSTDFAVETKLATHYQAKLLSADANGWVEQQISVQDGQMVSSGQSFPEFLEGVSFVTRCSGENRISNANPNRNLAGQAAVAMQSWMNHSGSSYLRKMNLPADWRAPGYSWEVSGDGYTVMPAIGAGYRRGGRITGKFLRVETVEGDPCAVIEFTISDVTLDPDDARMPKFAGMEKVKMTIRQKYSGTATLYKSLKHGHCPRMICSSTFEQSVSSSVSGIISAQTNVTTVGAFSGEYLETLQKTL